MFMYKFFLVAFLCVFIQLQVFSQRQYMLSSPDKHIEVTVVAADSMRWSVKVKGKTVLAPSPLALRLATGETLGNKAAISQAKTETVDTKFKAFFYKKDFVSDHYNQLTLTCKGDFGVIFRCYDDGVAYRFFTTRKNDLVVTSEDVSFNFDGNYASFVPHVRDLRGTEQFIQSFEALYTRKTVASVSKDTLAFLPALVDEKEYKVVLLEADVEDYPGMFLRGTGSTRLKGVFAPYPLAEYQGGYHGLNTMVSKRADYIAKVKGARKFPWRSIVIADRDAALLNNDMVQKLASPSRLADVTWVKPGKVAWDWWNDWNISHVDFRAGVNTDTYKYYIDFASENKLEYVILDEGWSNDLDMMDVSPKMNLTEILAYANQKNVGIILWGGWYAVHQKMDEVFKRYSAMGVKGFKIDFMDRDDQPMVQSLYTIAEYAAHYKMLVDYHGMYKPTGLQRTYPNVVNFEGVKGMENVKWTPNDDVPRYDVTIPFIRMMAGPVDYTPGAMRNATKSNFRPSNNLPMSQGTRCHQLAMYVVFEAPLQMMADNPTAYKKEQECTDFIVKVPTVFNETVALDGSVGEYVAIARKKDAVWYVGAMTNWNERDVTFDFSFLGAGNFEAEIFKDGMNADHDATDYKKEIRAVSSADKLTIHLAPGGGVAMRIYKK